MSTERPVRWDFRILGPTEVLRDAAPVRFRGSRERTLLTLLAVHANRTVSTDRIVEDLGGGAATDGALRALRVNVSRVRRALRDAGDVLVTRPAGYLLRVENEAVDAARFDVLVRNGREQAAAGDHRRAASTLRTALELWRGPALSDIASAPSARSEAARLEEGRLAALEDRLEADLACGRHGELVGELEALTSTHALRERLWAQRMLALYRAARLRPCGPTGSCAGYSTSSSASSPAPRCVAWRPPSSARTPSWDREPAPPRRRAEPARGSGVRTAATTGRAPFVGRAAERAELRRWLDAAVRGTGALVMIGGEPGVGKTRLAEELEAEARSRDMQVLVGHSYEMEGAAPYVAFVEILESALERAPDPQAFRRALGDEAAEVTKLVPQLRRVCPDIPPPLELPAEQERRLLFTSIREVVARTARRRPMLLVLDDLHWADDPSLLLVEHLAERLAEIPLLVVATFRDTEVDVGRPLARTFEDLRRRHLAHWMTLRRVPEEAVAELVGALVGRPPPPALVRAMFTETGGNPFFLGGDPPVPGRGGPAVRRRRTLPARPRRRRARRTRRDPARRRSAPAAAGRGRPPDPVRRGRGRPGVLRRAAGSHGGVRRRDPPAHDRGRRARAAGRARSRPLG